MRVGIYEGIRGLDDFVGHYALSSVIVLGGGGLMAQFALVGEGRTHVGKNKAGSFRTEPWPAAWRVGTSSPPSLVLLPFSLEHPRKYERCQAR